MPPAIPMPPAASDPPPKNARVAFEAATPLRVLMAVPVDAVASAEAALYAPNAVNAPPATPVTPPCNIDEANPFIFFNSSKSACSA